MLGSKGWTQHDSERLDDLEMRRNTLSDEEEAERNRLIGRENDASQPGGTPSITKFSQYTLPGGQNYREVLMHLPASQVSDEAALADAQRSLAHMNVPGITWEGLPLSDQTRMIENARYRLEKTAASQDNFNSSHWDQPNIVAHLRLNDRTGVASDAAEGQLYAPGDAQKLLHMEELQSDWGQQGRDKGFKEPGDRENFQRLISIPASQRTPEQQSWVNDYVTKPGKVPPGPYVGNTQQWADLGLKRALIEAARGDYTHLSWTPGADQAARYDLSKHISDLSYSPHSQNLQARAPSGSKSINEYRVTPENLPDYVGAETARKLLATPQGMHFNGLDNPNYDNIPQWAQEGWHTLSGQDLHVGGEGMKGFYDRQVPNQLSKLAKKLDPNAKIGTSRLAGRDDGDPFTAEELAQMSPEARNAGSMGKVVPSLEITPLMRQRILQGLPQYRRGGRVALEPVEGNPFDLQPPDRTMHQSDLHRAKGFPEPRSPMHARIMAASRDEPRHGFQSGGGLEAEEEKLQQGREIGTESGSDLGPASPVRSPGLFGGARPVQPSAQFGAPAVTEPAVAPAAPAPAPEPTIVRSNSEGGVLRHVDPAFPESRISTSAPWAANATPHAQGGNDISMDLMRGGDPLAGGLKKYLKGAYHKNANIIRGVDDDGEATGKTIPYVRLPDRPDGEGPDGALTAEQHLAHDDATHEALINHMESNIQAVSDAIPNETKQGSQQWYDGGHEITKQIALDNDIPHENAAGTVAALSPQKDWDMNVNLGRRVAHILKTTPADARPTPQMTQWMQDYAETKPVNRTTPNTVTRQDVLNDLQAISSKPWGQMGAADRAVYIRAYDEAHGPPDHLMVHDDRMGEPLPKGFHINNPDGSPSTLVSRYGPEYTNMVDQPSKVTWGSNNEIANAVKAYQAQNMSQISEAMGDGHKVRSFYNNLIAPNSTAHDVTGDTHAVATGLLRPLGAGSDEVSLGLGQTGSASAATGAQGLYPNVREAYKRVADRAGLIPRQMQSIVWEAVRGLWNPAQKRQAAVKNAVDGLWARSKAGEIEPADVQRQILGEGGQNIRAPRWQGSWNPSQ